MSTSFFKNTPPSTLFYAFALAGTIVAAGFIKLAGFDLWWHLKTGEIITLWKQIPNYDFFSYTAAGKPWVNHEWLFQVMSWKLFSNFGLVPFTLIQFFAAVIIAYATFTTIRLLTGSKNASLWGTVVVILAMSDRFMARPFLFSSTFIVLFCLILHTYAVKKTWLIYLLPLMTIVWINLHGGGILAPQIVTAFALGETLQKYLSERLKGEKPSAIDNQKIATLWIIALSCWFALLLNPHGIETLFFPFRHVQMSAILLNTQEWLPALDPRLDGIISQIFFRIVLVATPISFIIGRRSARFSHLALFVLSGLLILNGKRFTPDFVLINLPIIFFNFKEEASRLSFTPGTENLRSWGHVICITFLSCLFLRHGITSTVRGGVTGEVGFGTTQSFAPVEMVNFLKVNQIRGRVFNEMAVGGFLILTRWPEELVFIDGRTPVYGDKFFEEHVDAFRNSRNFEQLDAKYKFDYLVFKGDQIWELRFLHKYLWESPNWRLVYARRDGFVYLKINGKNADKIDKLRVTNNPLIDEMKKIGEI